MGELHEMPDGWAWWKKGRVLVYFLLGLVALEIAVLAGREVWRTYDPDDYREKLIGIHQYPSELVVIGGSPVAEGIDPVFLKGMEWKGRPLETVYNLGLLGATTTEIWHSVQHGLDEHKPVLLIYGITATDLNDSRQEPHGPWSLMSLADLIDWLRTKKHSNEWAVRHFLEGRCSRLWSLWHYRNGIRMWAADWADRLQPGSFPKASWDARHNVFYSSRLRRPDGFAPMPAHQIQRLDQMKANGFKQTHFHFLDKYRLGDHLKYLHRLIDWTEANGVDLVLVDMPVTAELDEKLPPYAEAFVSYRKALAEVEKSRGVRVLQASREATRINDSHFADLIHLNSRGCKRLSLWIRQQLTETAETIAR